MVICKENKVPRLLIRIHVCIQSILLTCLPAVTPCQHDTHLLAVCVERSGRNPKAQNMNAHVSSVRNLEEHRCLPARAQ